MSTPVAFISYSHDSPEHKAWVLKLGSDLRAMGIDVILDQWDLAPGQDTSLFMQKGISAADRVLLICSTSYVQKSQNGTGGVGYERLIVTSEVTQSIDTKKFIPIIRGSAGNKATPNFLGPRIYIDFENDAEYSRKLDELAREIHSSPINAKPPIGPNPFSSVPIAAPINSRATVPHQDWIDQQQSTAKKGILTLALPGYMELQIGVRSNLSKSQIELLEGVKESEIRTFGWPIAVTLENREGCQPRPFGDGIRAEIAINDGASRKSYDYWALRSDGDFYLLQSLFEDSKTANKIFFDTRIVRVTEALMFAERLYRKFGVPSDAVVVVRVHHSGLGQRKLASASRSRFLSIERGAVEVESISQIETTLGSMGPNRVRDVKLILSPLFMLFDFMQFQDSIYEEIVRNFEQGDIR